MEYTKLLGKVTLTADGLHDSDKSYDRLCLVYDASYRSFVSIKEVPANISIDNRSYWQPLNVISADNEDLIVDENLRLKFANKDFNPVSFSGMGYKILRKRKNNVITLNDFNEAHTLYVVLYDFLLNNSKITMPEDCAIYFKGGTLNSGTVVGTKTIAYGTVTRKGDAIFNGSWVESGTGGSADLDELISRIEKLELQAFPYTFTVSEDAVYKKGTAATVTLSWELTQGSTRIIPDKISINGETISPDLNVKTYFDVTTDRTYTIICEKDGVTFSKNVVIKFVNPSYFGVINSNFNATESSIKALGNEAVKNSKTYTTPNFTQKSQRNCYAYPKVFGVLTNIKDISGFNLNDSYNSIEVFINGEYYNVYTLITPSSVTDYKITFN